MIREQTIYLTIEINVTVALYVHELEYIVQTYSIKFLGNVFSTMPDVILVNNSFIFLVSFYRELKIKYRVSLEMHTKLNN